MVDQREGNVAEFLISQNALQELGILSSDQKCVSQQRIFGQRGGESWVYGYRVDLTGPDGCSTVMIKEKNYIGIGFLNSLHLKATQQEKMIKEIKDAGIPVPHTWGAYRSALYQEFFVNDGTRKALQTLENNSEGALPLLKQLISIGAREDEMGFRPLNFVGDLFFDGDSNRFVMMDIGFDLGGRVDRGDKCQRQLLKMYPQYANFINEQYAYESEMARFSIGVSRQS